MLKPSVSDTEGFLFRREKGGTYVMKKGKLLSLLLAAAVGAGSLAMTAQAAPAELPAQTAKTCGFCEGQRLGLERRLGNFYAGP